MSFKKEVSNEFLGTGISARLVPWDSIALDKNVAEIITFDENFFDNAELFFGAFEAWRDANKCAFVSCRLPQEAISESFFLEDKGFKFLEMIHRPILKNITDIASPNIGDEIYIENACLDDINTIELIAETAFVTDRFHLDFRLPESFANNRYVNWVRSSYGHKSQNLIKIVFKNKIVGFFITEEISPKTEYWHLTAISQDYQYSGIGYVAWIKAIEKFKKTGGTVIKTSISARNQAALNLYSKLNFRYESSLCTYHWVR